MSKVLFKVDRNGTKYYNCTDICPRCGGTGDYVRGINYGTCFLCGGTRVKTYVFKEYTPEHEAKLEAARIKRLEAKVAQQQAWNAEHADEIEKKNREIIEQRYSDFGCGKDGIGYVLKGNTFKIKDVIKSNGGKWIYGTWVCPIEIKCIGVETRKIDLSGHIGSGSQVWLDDYNLWKAIAE